MRKVVSFLLTCLLSVVLVVFVYFRLWGDGIPLTHDGPIHVVRMAGYYLALQQGQLPPRWGPNMANSLGYPVFNYNYPLANIVATAFIRLHLSYPTSYQLTLFLFIILGTIGTSIWLQTFTKKWLYVILGMVLYVTNPFLTTQVFVRGGAGEVTFIGLFPWVLWAISHVLDTDSTKLSNQVTLGVLGGLLALTHNVLVLFCLPVLAGYALWISRHHKRQIIRLIIPVGLAFLLSAFFWIPALAEKSSIVLDDAPITNDYEQHFLWPHQLLTSTWSYGFSRPGPVDGMSFRLSLVELLLIEIVSGWHLLHFRKKTTSLLLWILVLLELFLTTNASRFVWSHIPLSHYIQFPWRLLWFGHISLLAYFVWWASSVGISRKNTYLLVVLCLIEAFIFSRPQERVNRTAEEWLRAGETTSTMNENAPKTFQLDLAYQIKESQFKDQLVWVSTPSATVHIHTWDGTKREYEITSSTSATVVERTAYFPGWETSIDGIKTSLSAQDPWRAGLITFPVSAGTHIITSSFTQHTPARQVGNILTGVGIVSLMGGLLWMRRK